METEQAARDWQEMLDALLALDSGLSGWEMDFLESLDDLRARACLTDRQFAKLEELWFDRC